MSNSALLIEKLRDSLSASVAVTTPIVASTSGVTMAVKDTLEVITGATSLILVIVILIACSL